MNVIEGVALPGPDNGARVAERGRHLHVIDVEGGPTGEFAFFDANANGFDERFGQARAKVTQRKFVITKGNHLCDPSTGERPAPGVALGLGRLR